MRTEERARCLADACRDAFDVAAREVHHIDLVERIALFALALKDQSPAVGGPVAFPRPAAFDGEAPDPREELALLRRLLGSGLQRGPRGGRGRTPHRQGP